MFGSKLQRDFDDVPRNNSGVCLRAVICGQMHSLVLITFNFMYHFVLSRSFLFIYFFALLDFDHRMQDLKEKISLISKHPSIPNSKYIILSLYVLYNCPPKNTNKDCKRDNFTSNFVGSTNFRAASPDVSFTVSADQLLLHPSGKMWFMLPTTTPSRTVLFVITAVMNRNKNLNKPHSIYMKILWSQINYHLISTASFIC